MYFQSVYIFLISVVLIYYFDIILLIRKEINFDFWHPCLKYYIMYVIYYVGSYSMSQSFHIDDTEAYHWT
jgi:hypothetical protein